MELRWERQARVLCRGSGYDTRGRGVPGAGASSLAQCLEDGTVTLRSQLHVLVWLERGGACARQPQVSSRCPVSPAWAAYLRGTLKERGCCCTSASSTFCSRTGEWAACGPQQGRVRAGSHSALRRLLTAFFLTQEQWLQWAAYLTGFQMVDCFLDLAWLLAFPSTPKRSLYLWRAVRPRKQQGSTHRVCGAGKPEMSHTPHRGTAGNVFPFSVEEKQGGHCSGS